MAEAAARGAALAASYGHTAVKVAVFTKGDWPEPAAAAAAARRAAAAGGGSGPRPRVCFVALRGGMAPVAALAMAKLVGTTDATRLHRAWLSRRARDTNSHTPHLVIIIRPINQGLL